MDKIQTITKLQKYLFLFAIGVVLTMATTFFPIPFLGLAISAYTIVTYVLLWMSYAAAKKNSLLSKNKYLLLAIVITLTTIIIMVVTAILTAQMSLAIVNSGIDMATMTPEQITTLGERLVPKFLSFMLVIQGATIMLNVLYLGITWMIYNNNKADLIIETELHEQMYQ